MTRPGSGQWTLAVSLRPRSIAILVLSHQPLLLPLTGPCVSETLGKRVVVDLQLGHLKFGFEFWIPQILAHIYPPLHHVLTGFIGTNMLNSPQLVIALCLCPFSLLLLYKGYGCSLVNSTEHCADTVTSSPPASSLPLLVFQCSTCASHHQLLLSERERECVCMCVEMRETLSNCLFVCARLSRSAISPTRASRGEKVQKKPPPLQPKGRKTR